MQCQAVRDRPALVGRRVVSNHMDFFTAGLIDHKVCKERDEFSRGVPRSRFAKHLTGLGVESSMKRQGAVTKVLKARAVRRAPGTAAEPDPCDPGLGWRSFSSTENTVACAGGFRYNPIMLAAFFSNPDHSRPCSARSDAAGARAYATPLPPSCG